MALHLKRRVGESIIISDELVVTIKEVKGRNEVAISIHGPKSIIVRRFESHVNIDKIRCPNCDFYACICKGGLCQS